MNSFTKVILVFSNFENLTFLYLLDTVAFRRITIIQAQLRQCKQYFFVIILPQEFTCVCLHWHNRQRKD